MDRKVTDKIKEMLTENDLQLFESAVEQMITERISAKEEELKVKYEEIAENYVTEEVDKRVTEEKAKLVEDYDTKLENLEKKVVSKLDSFFEHVISEQISDETIEKLAVNEVLSPVVEGIKKVYSENFIELNSDSSKKISEADKKIKKLENQLSESVAKLMESEERLEKTATYLLISEKTEGMTASEKQRLVKMLKNEKFDIVKEKIDTYVEIIKESATPKVSVTPKVNRKRKPVSKKKTLDESIDVNDHIDEKKASKPETVIEEDNEFKMSDIANKYL